MFFASSIITRRVVRSKFGFLGCPFRNFGSICSNLLENQESVVSDDAQYSKSDNSKWVFTESNGVSLKGKEIVSFYSCESSVFGVEHGEFRETNGVRRIKSVLVGCGWDLERNIELDEFNVVRILNVLYDRSSSATLSFFFYRLCETYAESEHRVWSVCTMVHILVAGNMNHKAVDLLRFLISKRNCSDDWHLYLFDVVEDMHRDRRVLEIVYSMLVGCYVKENMVDMAVKLVNRMKVINVFPDIGVCNSLIKVLLKLKMMELAWELFEEMLKRGMGNTCMVSLFIHQHCAEGSLESACKLLIEMPKFGFRPDVVAYSIVIDALCKKSFLKEGISAMFKMVQIGIRVDPVLFSCALDSFCKMKGSSEALKLFKVFKFAPNIFVYSSFISNLCSDGRMAEAVELVQEMSELSINPDSYVYTAVIGGFCKVDNLDKALAYLGAMLKKGFEPTTVTYTVLIDAYCKIGNLDMAGYLFGMVEREGLDRDVIMYNTLMDGYWKKGYAHKSFQLLNMMRHANVSPDAATYNIIIHGLARRGFVEESRKILNELVRRGFSPDAFSFTSVIGGFSKEGNFEEAILLWSHMSEHGVRPDVVTCSALLHGYCKAHRMGEANSLFHKMLEAGLDPDLVLYNTLIHGFCNEGDINEACKLIAMMAECGIIPNDITYKSLVRAFEKKWISHPAENAFISMQQILLEYGVHVDKSQYPSGSHTET